MVGPCRLFPHKWYQNFRKTLRWNETPQATSAENLMHVFLGKSVETYSCRLNSSWA